MRTKFKVLLTMLVLLLGAVGLSSRQQVSAATNNNIAIDGDLSDWASVPKTKTSTAAETAMVVSDDYLYIYASANPTGEAASDANGWGAKPQFYVNQSFNLKVGNQNYTITPKAKNSTNYHEPTTPGSKVNVDIDVFSSTANSSNNNGDAEGVVTAVASTNQAGYNDIFEGKIALSDLQLADGNLTFLLTGGPVNFGKYSVSVNHQYTSANSSDSSSSSSGGNYTGHPNIVIDGGFDDWADVPKTLIRFDDYNVKQGALLQYDGNLYLYINMSSHRGQGYNALQPSSYEFTIGSTKYDMQIEDVNGTTYQPLTAVNQVKPVTASIYRRNDWQGSRTPAGVIGYVTRTKTAAGGTTDIMEIKLPLKAFGGAADDGQTITLYNSALGKQTLTVTGGSTGPVLLAAGGFGIALFGIWQFNRRKKRAEELTL
ncbi:Firmicu-CTERM sorting domain-containing protein [Lapidilactobacillus wuchangensis]|uniref:Firmicu-CTERM sorting domain-containing protein n=1 Tax=Lapidilactobacillus wuchangensis TaxID=2486001 RepID=UPI000F7795CF|nr:Firmicu-CTERM sorting domain-containing protein [Lapidilactobacillus wuchangensis]